MDHDIIWKCVFGTFHHRCQKERRIGNEWIFLVKVAIIIGGKVMEAITILCDICRASEVPVVTVTWRVSPTLSMFHSDVRFLLQLKSWNRKKAIQKHGLKSFATFFDIKTKDRCWITKKCLGSSSRKCIVTQIW